MEIFIVLLHLLSFQKLVAQMKQDPQVSIYFYIALFTLKIQEITVHEAWEF